MNRKLTALALFTAATCLAGGAQAKDLSGWFINGGAGTAHYRATAYGVSGSESDTSFQVTGGWRSQFIGLEAGYVDLGSVEGNDGIGDSAKLSGKGWTLGINGHFNPTDKWYISARAGFFNWKLDGRLTLADNGGNTTYSDSNRGTNGYAGIGTGVDFNRHVSLGVNFDYYQIREQDYKIHAKVYTVNMEYRF
ncbi:MAG TPA: outer membrane beta-barrel protein [Rhodanobacteraceae bacterium]|jgi:hypothetical protein|nr:outer membrane beta-barrel protein [Rhodanobacteraceae bacterium]